MNNILIVRFSSLGDIVLTTGVIKYVKECLPDINIDVLTIDSFIDVFQNFGYARNIYSINKNATVKELVKTLNKMPDYDAVFDLHDNLRSWLVKLINPAKHFTYKKNSLARRLFVKFRICKNKLDKNVTERYCEVLSDVLKIPVPRLERLRPFINFKRVAKNGDDIVVTIHPFASKPTKVWTYFYELCSKLVENDLYVKVVGSGKMKLPLNVEDATGFVPLEKLIANIADSDVFISTDSGPMHIAIALNIPTIGIFGPTTKELGFYPSFSNCRILENNQLKCRPCHIHGSNVCIEKHFKCMLSTSVDEVVEATSKYLKK